MDTEEVNQQQVDVCEREKDCDEDENSEVTDSSSQCYNASAAVWPAYRKSNHSHTNLFTLRNAQLRVNCPIELFISLI